MKRFVEVLPLLGELAELENAVLRLARELRKTQRRCNALSKMFIPDYRETIAYIVGEPGGTRARIVHHPEDDQGSPGPRGRRERPAWLDSPRQPHPGAGGRDRVVVPCGRLRHRPGPGRGRHA